MVAQISSRFVQKPWGSGMNQLHFRAPEEEVTRMVGTHATVSRVGLNRFSLLQTAVKGKALVAQSCPTLCDPIDYSLGEGNRTPLQLAWKIPWTEEPGRLQSMVSLRVGHD